MNAKTMNQVVEHQVALTIKLRGIQRQDFNDLEYLKLKYQIALELLCDAA